MSVIVSPSSNRLAPIAPSYIPVINGVPKVVRIGLIAPLIPSVDLTLPLPKSRAAL